MARALRLNRQALKKAMLNTKKHVLAIPQAGSNCPKLAAVIANKKLVQAMYSVKYSMLQGLALKSFIVISVIINALLPAKIRRAGETPKIRSRYKYYRLL